MDWTGTRVLDPTCGSGSFLVEAIRRKREAAAGFNMTAESTVQMITESVWGFDLNPLAVQVSRTNFLMALADLLKDTPGQQITIVGAGPGTPDLPVPVAPSGDCASRSGVGHRYHLYPAAARIHLSGGDHGLVQPVRAGLGSSSAARRCRLLTGTAPGCRGKSGRV